MSLFFLATLAVGFALQYLQVIVMQKVGQETMYDLRKEIFGHLQRLPMSFYDRSPVGRLVTRVTTDVDALNDLLVAGISAMINDAFLLLVFVFIMLHMNWRLALATFAVMPLIFVATWIFRNKVRDANRRIRTAIARINAFLQEHISGMGVVQLFSHEKKSREQFAYFNRVHMEAYKDAILAFAFFYPAVEFLGVVAIITVFWYGGLRSLSGLVPVGVLIAFMQYAQRFFQPIQDLSDKFNILQAAMAASERIFRLLDEPLPAFVAEQGRALGSIRGEIEFRNVSFAYRGDANPTEDDWILRDVSFHVAPGQTVAIVGHTGAGKTTTIQLLLRFYDIQRGQILVDGVDIRELNVQELRRQFGIVLQDPFLFTGTLESNVRLGTESVHRADVDHALREVGLGPFSIPCPRVSTPPSANAAPPLRRPAPAHQLRPRPRAQSPFLILDEATSSVDTKTELHDPRSPGPSAHRPHRHGHRPPPQHHPARRPHPRLPQRPPPRTRHPPGTPRQRGIYYRLYQLQYKDQELGLPAVENSPLTGVTTALPTPMPAHD
jgi:ATP-binding cassette subfamily B multidrug efflux pump